ERNDSHRANNPGMHLPKRYQGFLLAAELPYRYTAAVADWNDPAQSMSNVVDRPSSWRNAESTNARVVHDAYRLLVSCFTSECDAVHPRLGDIANIQATGAVETSGHLDTSRANNQSPASDSNPEQRPDNA